MNGKVDLAEKLSRFSDRWSPRAVAEFNGHDVMVVKGEGEFVWHSHEDTDDFFPVLKGRLVIQMRDRDDVVLGPGELYVVPRGVEHKPVAEEETHLLLIKPTGTPNTGDERTAAPAGSCSGKFSANLTGSPQVLVKWCVVYHSRYPKRRLGCRPPRPRRIETCPSLTSTFHEFGLVKMRELCEGERSPRRRRERRRPSSRKVAP